MQKSIKRLENIVERIERKEIVDDKNHWNPSEKLLQTLIDNGNNLGISIKKSTSSIRSEDIEPIFKKMNIWMEEIIELKRENDILKTKIKQMEQK